MESSTIQNSSQTDILSFWNSEFRRQTHSGLIVAGGSGSWIGVGHTMFIGYK